MDSAGQEVGKIETRLRQLGAKLDKLVVKADEAGTEVKVEYRKQIDCIKDKHAAVHALHSGIVGLNVATSGENVLTLERLH